MRRKVRRLQGQLLAGVHGNRQKIFSCPLQVETKADSSYLIVAGIQDRSVRNGRHDSNTVSEIGWLQKMVTCYRTRSLYGIRRRLGLFLSLRFYLGKKGFILES